MNLLTLIRPEVRVFCFHSTANPKWFIDELIITAISEFLSVYDVKLDSFSGFDDRYNEVSGAISEFALKGFPSRLLGATLQCSDTPRVKVLLMQAAGVSTIILCVSKKVTLEPFALYGALSVGFRIEYGFSYDCLGHEGSEDYGLANPGKGIKRVINVSSNSKRDVLQWQSHLAAFYQGCIRDVFENNFVMDLVLNARCKNGNTLESLINDNPNFGSLTHLASGLSHWRVPREYLRSVRRCLQGEPMLFTGGTQRGRN
jgi:hypothetical protein